VLRFAITRNLVAGAAQNCCPIRWLPRCHRAIRGRARAPSRRSLLRCSRSLPALKISTSDTPAVPALALRVATVPTSGGCALTGTEAESAARVNGAAARGDCTPPAPLLVPLPTVSTMPLRPAVAAPDPSLVAPLLPLLMTQNPNTNIPLVPDLACADAATQPRCWQW
jgi:hypothetical protein